VIRNRIDDPTKRVADIGEETVDERSDEHRNWLFKIDAGLYSGRTSNEYEKPTRGTGNKSEGSGYRLQDVCS
jgi:hypothetical protein